MPSLSIKVCDYQVIVSELDAGKTERENLAAPKPAAEKKSENRVVASASKICMASRGEQGSTLVGGQLVSKPHTNSPDPYHAADAGGQFWAQ